MSPRGSWDAPIVQHAPLYPFLLATGGALGVDPLNGARWLNALTFGANIFLVHLLIRHSVSHLHWLWVIGSTLMLVLAPMLTVHVTALSEPVFLAAALAVFLLLALYVDGPSPGRLFASAIVMGRTLLARYAGAACLLTGAIAILLMAATPWRLRVRDTVMFGVNACMPMSLWIAFAVEGEVSVHISQKDYLDYREPLAFDQLCTSLGQVFIDFFSLYDKGEGVRVIDRMDDLKISVLS